MGLSIGRRLAAVMVSPTRTLITRRLSSHPSPEASCPPNHKRETSIGFIGLGAMGREMASNLLAKSQASISSFVIHDASQPSMSAFLDQHFPLTATPTMIVAATTPASVARLASTIVTMLPSSAEVEQVYLDPETGILNGIKDHPSSSMLCIDSTTLDLARATAVSNKLHEAGAEMIDGPVSGGVVGAKDASLTFMCGGSESTFSKAQALLERMGKRSIYCGNSGAGLAAKLANNMLLAISMIGTAEAMILGQKLGLKPDLLATIINSSTGRCWSSEINNPAPGALLPTKSTPADRGWEGGFASRLMAKDLGLALQAASDCGIDVGAHLPVGSVAGKIYQTVGTEAGLKDKDFSAVYAWLEGQKK